jgi:protein-disulfide isomerase
MILRTWVVAGLLAVPAMLWAAETKTSGDTSTLRPPQGATVAIVAFEDLQCPDCADTEALLQEASAKYGVPLVRRDFPLPMHNWSFEAHVLARYFDKVGADTKSGATKVGDMKDAAAKSGARVLPLGEQFRRWVYANQASINKQSLRGMAERFADQHGLELPANIDPKGELAKLVQADFALGQQVSVIHTPTVFVVSVSQRGAPLVETLDRDRLFSMIEQMQAAVKQSTGETKR